MSFGFSSAWAGEVVDASVESGSGLGSDMLIMGRWLICSFSCEEKKGVRKKSGGDK